MAAVFASIFGVGAATMLVMLDFGVARFAEEELHSALYHQMAIMRADAQLEGSAALVNILTEHVRTDSVSRYRYLVIPPVGPRFNSGLPEDATRFDGFGIVEAPSSDVSSIGRKAEVRMLVLTERMADGSFMAVGRESYPLDDLRAGLHKIAIWGSLALMLLAVVAGLLAGLLFLRRLKLVNATTGRIIDGNLSERLPAIGFGQEFDDLTRNLNAMLDRLEATMAAMRQVSTDVAHDLRMPLTRLRNRLEELHPASDAQAARIESAIEEADELLSLFNTMLRIARLQAGDVHQDMVPVDLSLLVERAIEAYQPAAEQSGHLLLHRSAGPHIVVGDAAMLNQLLANLIDNGLQHTPAGTSVEIALSSAADGVRLLVKDDGPGVGEAEVPNLTKRFYRADDSRTRPGTGLGLTLVSAIVDLHEASLRISGHPGFAVEVWFSRVSPA
ncbi:HAMP domain-containing histidine kinase [Sandaracinobacter sp. RS1-74]|uniref:sensor histidine kinase n=1 Tax=Sandaracinobacteroides sayramensis TaxID=2913411 RepID=UPI001EDA6EAE|nr:HAMP domain-containing sensor histidine kinase [Sandaracinobacteroides sayramensis]MCG2842061.1 HAMP domain-containing histidine kinase [Sandaracinobacteroides sayramensis]